MRQLFNEGWQFVKTGADCLYETAESMEKQPVCLPHDWAIGDIEQFYRDVDGWYFKTFKASFPQKHTEVCLRFDGVYMDADIYCNGKLIKTHRYGYTAFFVDIGRYLRPDVNTVAVHIRYRCPNSRWYSGAGIYRDTELISYHRQHIIPDGIQIKTERLDHTAWRLTVAAEAVQSDALPVSISLYDGEQCILEASSVILNDQLAFESVLPVIVPWSLEQPKLYRLRLTLLDQTEELNIGFREVKITPDSGFFLNGEYMKLHGVCLHHDLGALGAAFHPDAARRQLMLMKSMGANAVRTSHNPPASRFLDLCDELGILVIDEAFDMWELPKTEYDNARFFPQTWQANVTEWIRRDRCHPCVIMWSIGNEIQDMHLGETGYRWAVCLTDEVRKHDVFTHAQVTFGSNYMPWEGAQHCAEYVRLAGYNYAEPYYDIHHQAHPGWMIYGSETSSMVQSRGIYHFPMEEDILAEEDLQCSALLNSKTSWGHQSLPHMLAEDRKKRFSLGQFIWSGTDYIGEPTPYHTKNSYFGQADTACFPKDSYYMYQAMWTDRPMIHIGVSWKWNPGQPIDVPVMTNCASAELILNGVSLGKKTVDRDDETSCLPVWKVPYSDGVLEARGYDNAGKLLVSETKHSYGAPASLKVTAESNDVVTGGLAFVTISVLDDQGYPVEDANLPVTVEIHGPGCLIGMDNGDSTDQTSYHTNCKRLFSGKALAIIGAKRAGKITVKATSPGVAPAILEIKCTGNDSHRFDDVFVKKQTGVCSNSFKIESTWTRRIELIPQGSTVLTRQTPSVRFLMNKEPADSPYSIALRVTNAQGVDYPGAALKRLDDHTVEVTATADGQFYLRATSDNGDDHTNVLSTYPISAAGIGGLVIDPYRMVSASLSDQRIGEIAPGNEQGIAFAKEGLSGVGFSCVDFGPVGSDRFELPIFALDAHPHLIELWDGHPEHGGVCLKTCTYQMPSIWNTYQSGFYQLKEPLRGKHTLFLTATEKVHLKGIRFEKQSRAMRINFAADAEEIYGDQYRINGRMIENIGNNVTIAFDHMEFSVYGQYTLTLRGRTARQAMPIILRVINESGSETSQSLNVQASEKFQDHTYHVTVPAGMSRVEFIFLPGSQFDFEQFCFKEN